MTADVRSTIPPRNTRLVRAVRTCGLIWLALVVSGVAMAFVLAVLHAHGWLHVDDVLRGHLFRSRGRSSRELADVLTSLGSAWGVATCAVAVAAVTATTRSWRPAAFALIVVGGALSSTLAIKLLTNLRSTDALETYGSSFPSGHAAAGAAICLATALIAQGLVRTVAARRFVWVLAAALAVGVAWSRVAVGAHWVVDALGGLAMAVIWLGVAVRVIGVPGRDPAAEDVLLASPQ